MGHTATDLHRQEIRITDRLITVTIAVLLHEAVIRAEAAVAHVHRIAVAVHVPRVEEAAVVAVVEDDASSDVSGKMNLLNKQKLKL